MKSVSFVPKTVPGGSVSRSPLDRLSVNWHCSMIWYSFNCLMNCRTDKTEEWMNQKLFIELIQNALSQPSEQGAIPTLQLVPC